MLRRAFVIVACLALLGACATTPPDRATVSTTSKWSGIVAHDEQYDCHACSVPSAVRDRRASGSRI